MPVTGGVELRWTLDGTVRSGVIAEAATAGDGAAHREKPSAAERYVQVLAVLPGAEHVAVVDVSGERVLGEWGGPPGSAQVVIDRARRAADPSRPGRRELEDVVSTIGTAFHLSRLVLAGPGHPESMWVAVRINRVQGSLTWSRGVLAGLGGPAGDVHRDHVGPAHEQPPGPHEQDPALPSRAPAVVPPPPPPPTSIPSTSPSEIPRAVPATRTAPTTEGSSNGQVTLTATAPHAWKATLTPTATVAPETSEAPDTSTPKRAAPATVASRAAIPEASTTGSGTEESSVADAAIADIAATVELAASHLSVPGARASSENRPEPLTLGPDRRSPFAPVITVLPPPSPVPEDGTTEEPAPMPAPIIIAPPLSCDRRPVEGEPAIDSGPDESGESGLLDPSPRHTPGVRLVPRLPSPAALPSSRPASSVAHATAFTDEPSVLKRLIYCLRRPS
ncbi:hypothetical protein LQ327_00485 [Actinomycetospora endophytica]|uniref:Uncharacterized protein n=1 Tax=Actinomycetospora endophytica TaxID=2291215 RepID=A0ABS8P0U5_9PSEU|nr:hypothetical protein [Actinomycetospora endophytica]MCD2191866.1 hypothetical protein [Actinomycetospora endophytica]